MICKQFAHITSKAAVHTTKVYSGTARRRWPFGRMACDYYTDLVYILTVIYFGGVAHPGASNFHSTLIVFYRSQSAKQMLKSKNYLVLTNIVLGLMPEYACPQVLSRSLKKKR